MNTFRKAVSLFLTVLLLIPLMPMKSAEAASSTGIAKVLFTFDDGDIGNLTYAAPILHEKGFSGTAYVGRDVPEQFWSEGKMNDEQMQELYSYYGWDLGNHSINHTDQGYATYPHSLEYLRQVYLENQNWLLSKGWTRAAYHVAYPYGAHTDELIEVLKGIGVKTARIAGKQTIPSGSLYELNCVDFGWGESIIKTQIDMAVNSNSTLILLGHGVNHTANDYTITDAYFQRIVDYVAAYAAAGQLEVMTISEWYNSLYGTDPEAVHPESVSLNQTAITLGVGESYTLAATVLPADADNKTVLWTTDNGAVAEVDTVGKVTARGTGTAVITATSVDGNKTAVCSVKVTDEKPAKLLFTFDDGDLGNLTYAAPILYQKGFSATAYVGRDVPQQYWSSGKMTDAQLEELYTRYGWDLGNHSINHTDQGYATYPHSLEYLRQVYLENQNWLISKGWTRGAYHVAYPYGAHTDELIEVLKGIGVRTARIAGKQTIPSGSLYELNCVDIGWGESIIKGQIDMAVNSDSTLILLAHGVYETAHDYTVSETYFRSIVEYAAQYVESGRLEVVTISEWYHELYGSVPEPEPVHPESVTLDRTSMTLTAGETGMLTAVVLPAEAENKEVTWTTSNAAVAVVDAVGKVTAAGAGSAVITVTTVDGGKTAACSVTVEAVPEPEPIHPESVTLDRTSMTLTAGGMGMLTAVVLPAEAENKEVTWTTSNAAVAVVDAVGKVTAAGAGSAVITVTTVDGGKTAACSVMVEAVPEPEPAGAKLLFTFDDGDVGALQYAAPILYQKGFSATAYIGRDIPQQYWSAGKMTEEQLNQLYTQYGWDLANHTLTHTNLGFSTYDFILEILKQEYLENQNWLISRGWTRGAYHVAYPYGEYTNELIDILKGIGVKTGRLGIVQSVPSGSLYELNSIEIEWGEAVVKSWIDSAVAKGSTLILRAHGISEAPSDYTISSSYFQNIVDYAAQYVQDGKLEVMTISERYQ